MMHCTATEHCFTSSSWKNWINGEKTEHCCTPRANAQCLHFSAGVQTLRGGHNCHYRRGPTTRGGALDPGGGVYALNITITRKFEILKVAKNNKPHNFQQEILLIRWSRDHKVTGNPPYHWQVAGFSFIQLWAWNVIWKYTEIRRLLLKYSELYYIFSMLNFFWKFWTGCELSLEI